MKFKLKRRHIPSFLFLFLWLCSDEMLVKCYLIFTGLSDRERAALVQAVCQETAAAMCWGGRSATVCAVYTLPVLRCMPVFAAMC